MQTETEEHSTKQLAYRLQKCEDPSSQSKTNDSLLKKTKDTGQRQHVILSWIFFF